INPVYIYLKQKLADASTQVASLTAEVNHLESKTQELRKTINTISAQVLEIEVAESTFDSEIAVLTTNFQTLAAKLQEARLAKEEQGGAIRVVESPIVPQVAVGPGRSRIFLPAGAIGLLVGIVMALMVHYIQKGTLKASPPAPSRKDS
ncbi:MAG: GNVR domain-containing protein, partial [Chloroflexota bacterium]